MTNKRFLELPIRNFELLEKYREILGDANLKRFLEGETLEQIRSELPKQ